jgi:hypothetical protein
MGLKGYRLWFMGQLDSTCTAPPCAAAPPLLLPAPSGPSASVCPSQPPHSRHAPAALRNQSCGGCGCGGGGGGDGGCTSGKPPAVVGGWRLQRGVIVSSPRAVALQVEI